MQSHDVLRTAIEGVGAKKVAAAVGVSASLVYKWCEKRGDPESTSGTRNPLDRLRLLLEATGDESLLQWLCRQRDGYFVQNPAAVARDFGSAYVNHTQKMLQDFSELLQVMSESIANDGRIDTQESGRIRQEWEELKRYGEQFVCACEQGLFDGKS